MSLFFLCWVLQSLSKAAGVKRETSTTEVKNHLAGAEREPVEFERDRFEDRIRDAVLGP